MTAAAETLWTPAPARIAASNMTAFEKKLAAHCQRSFSGYDDWHAYSTAQPAAFWRFYLQHSRLPVRGGEEAAVAALSDAPMPYTRWFDGATTNYARALLYPVVEEDIGAQTAIIAAHEDGRSRCLTYDELRAQVAACAAALRAAGVGSGDRVAALIGNVPEAVILLCACASIGAVFSSCSPDFGEQAATARFGQIQPKLLFAQPAYRYQGKRYDIMPMIKTLAEATAGGQNIIFVPDNEAEDAAALPAAQCWQQWLKTGAGAPLEFAELPFDHPLYILYSSGTTGLPKAIVHRGGGVMLKHHSEHYLHSDIRRGDCVFYFTTCGWMMWNWLVSALMQAAAILLYEGSPVYPAADNLWHIAQRHGVTLFGASPRFIQGNKAAQVAPAGIADLSALRTVASTGSPLSPAGFEWIYEQVKSDVHVASISGGTDIVGCFLLGNPNLPVVAGQLQVAAAGVDIAAADADGNAVIGKPGELISRVPFPSMPLRFWQDDNYERYRAAYFSRYPGVWRHGDMITVIAGGGYIVHGRSDATLNPGGVRIGSADIYRPLERIAAIAEAAAVAKKLGDEDEEVWLFVVLQDGAVLDEALRTRIKTAIRAAASPRHVPRRIIAVSQLPRTRSGKTTEMAIADVINGRTVKNRTAMANPQALDEIAAAVS